MSTSVQNHYTTFVSTTGTQNTYFFYAEWSSTATITVTTRNFFYTYGTNTWTAWTTGTSGFWYSTLAGSNPANIPLDVNMSWYPYLTDDNGNHVYGATIVTRTYANAATASTPSVSNITSSSADLSCDFVPQVNVSTCSAQLQYKRTVDSVWLSAGLPNTTATGTTTATVGPISLTGLTASTSYDVRLLINRTTSSNPTTTSTVVSFTTSPGAPTVTTDPASTISETTAQLNATVTVNAGTNVQVYWKWDTVNPPVAHITAGQTVSADGSFQQALSGLTANTTYYSQAFTSFVTPTGSPASGSVVSFSTATSPQAVAAQEDRMTQFEYDRIYGAAATVYFTLASPSGTSSDRYVTTAPGTLFAAGDVKISKDGAAFANATNTPTQIAGSNPLYALALTASEMQAEDVVVQIVDQNGPAFRDAVIHVRSKIQTGQIKADASNLTNTSAMLLTGVGTGSGLEAVAGATGFDIKGAVSSLTLRSGTAQAGGASTITLDASANASDNYYRAGIVLVYSGTGAGQSRVIISYVGSTKVATVNRSWVTNPDSTSKFVVIPGEDPWRISPGAELSAFPTFASNYADLLQWLFQRIAYKHDQSATLFQTYKADSSTVLASGAVSDDGATFTQAKLS